MEDKVVYRNAIEHDLDGISEVDKAAFGLSSYPRFFIRQAFDVFGSLLIVAEIPEGHIGGYTLGAINSDNPRKGWIMSLAVKPEYHNKGIGKRLTEKLLSKLFQRGVEQIFLTVRPDNALAISLYKQFGFSEQKYDKNYFGIGNSRLLMVFQKKGGGSRTTHTKRTQRNT